MHVLTNTVSSDAALLGSDRNVLVIDHGDGVDDTEPEIISSLRSPRARPHHVLDGIVASFSVVI